MSKAINSRPLAFKPNPLTLALLALTPFAFAAPQSSETNVNVIESEAEPEELDAVTVTGSRIKRAGYDTLEPATSISREDVSQRGITNIADSLNEIPGFGAGVTPEGNQSGFGASVNFVNRFGLGTNRTLTTVNGRRFVSSNPITIFGPAGPGLQVDLNAIPTQLIERVDNLTVGGAPVYGSDAIAGVVNLTLRDNFEGTEAGFTYGLTERGDNERVNLRAIWGTNFAEDRGNVTLAATVDTAEGVNQIERENFRLGQFFGVNPLATGLANQPGRTPMNDGRFNPNIPFNTGPSDGIPNSVLFFNRRLQQLTPGGLLFPSTGAATLDATGTLRGFGADSRTYVQFDRNGNLVNYNPGTPFGPSDSAGGDGWFLVENGQITSDLERANLFSNGHFDFSDSWRGYYEALYFRSEGTEINDQPIFNATQFGGLSAPLTFSATDPRLTDQARARLSSLGVSSFRISRASRDLVVNNSRAETDLYRVVLGASNDFEWGERSFTWDTSINYGKSDVDNFANVLNQQNFINAINVTRNAGGQIVCDTTGTIGVIAGGVRPIADANCVPLDIFGEGRPSDAARNYVTGRTLANSVLKQTIFNSNLTGSFLDYYAGSIQFAAGYEYRKEEGEFNPDSFQRAGLGRAVAIGGLTGEFNTNEIFGELVIPVVSPENEIPGVYALDVELKGRRVDNSVNGAFDTYTYGLQWNVLPDLRLRGNRTRSLRAPAITELFTPVSTAFFAANDPCDGRFIGQPARPGAPSGPGTPRFDNCQALFRQLGLATNATPLTNFTSNIVSATQQGVTSGDPGLRNEDAFSSTFGFVWEPEFFSGFSLAMDYIEINIEDAILSLTATQLGNLCFDDPNFNQNDARNGNSFCSRLNRNAAGQLVATVNPDGTTTPAVRTGFFNASQTDFRGITSQASYNFELESGYRFNVSANAFNLRELKNQLNAGLPDFNDGELGDPSRSYQFKLGVNKGKLGANLQANYQSAQVFNRTFNVETRDILKVDSYTSFDLGLNYNYSDQATLRLAVTNLTDKQPPLGTTGIGFYDILGRRFALTGEYRF
jgi:outer membrane receptor protein involved in Fe transport